MRLYSLLPLALILVASIFGCQSEQTAPPPSPGKSAEIKPFLIKTNAGIDHEFYRDVSLEAFLKMLPSGAVDSLNLDIGNGPQVYALIKVPDQVGMELTRIRFETTFKTQDGQKIDKSWTAAKDRKSGKVMAVFCLPLSVVEGETKLLTID
jgi:hypothetical protein